MMYDIIVFENLRFRPHENEEVAFLKKKKSTLGTVFENLHVWCPKTPFTCGRKAKTEGKKLFVFKKIPAHVDGALFSHNRHKCLPFLLQDCEMCIKLDPKFGKVLVKCSTLFFYKNVQPEICQNIKSVITTNPRLR